MAQGTTDLERSIESSKVAEQTEERTTQIWTKGSKTFQTFAANEFHPSHENFSNNMCGANALRTGVHSRFRNSSVKSRVASCFS